MCTVNTQSGFRNPEASTVRLAMKLPRYGTRQNSAASGPSTVPDPVPRRTRTGAPRNIRPPSIGVSLPQEPYRGRQTQGLPIPCQVGRSLSRSVDKSDLTRMYDYATWNMYERIVSARRMRLASQAESSRYVSSADRKNGKDRAQHTESNQAASLNQSDASTGDTDKTSSSCSHSSDNYLSPHTPEGEDDYFIFQLDM